VFFLAFSLYRTYQDLGHPGMADCYVGSHLEDE
jgi:hypothetical protein